MVAGILTYPTLRGMTNDVVASQEHGKDMDQGNRKRPAPKDVEEELTKNSSKRLRDIPNEDAAEAAGGKAFACYHLITCR